MTTPASSTLPWSASTTRTCRAEVGGRTLTPERPGHRGGIGGEGQTGPGGGREPGRSSSPGRRRTAPGSRRSRAPGSDTQVEARRRAEPGARRSVRRQAAHEASAEVSTLPARPRARAASASSPPPRPRRPPEEPLEGAAHLGGGPLPVPMVVAHDGGGPGRVGRGEGGELAVVVGGMAPSELRSEKKVVRESPGPSVKRAFRAAPDAFDWATMASASTAKLRSTVRPVGS